MQRCGIHGAAIVGRAAAVWKFTGDMCACMYMAVSANCGSFLRVSLP